VAQIRCPKCGKQFRTKDATALERAIIYRASLRRELKRLVDEAKKLDAEITSLSAKQLSR